MATTFNDLLGLPPTATFSDRRQALRALTLPAFRDLCDLAVGLYVSPEVAYDVFRGTIVPEPWNDIRCAGDDYQAMWGDDILATAPVKRGDRLAAINAAEKSLRVYYAVCYPVRLEDFPLFDIQNHGGLFVGILDRVIHTCGVDIYSVLADMVDLTRYLAEEGLTGPASAYADATLFEVSHG